MTDIPTLQYFAANLERLLPHGASTAEITVPGLLTTLLLVRLENKTTKTRIMLTETIRPSDNLRTLELTDIVTLGQNHPEDHPSIQTVLFVCSTHEDLFMATPVSSFDHRNRRETDIFDYDEDGHIIDANEPRKDRLFSSTAKKIEKWREMGFFDKTAQRQPAKHITRNDVEDVYASITIEYEFSLETLDFFKESFQRRLTFLVNAIDESIANDR